MPQFGPEGVDFRPRARRIDQAHIVRAVTKHEARSGKLDARSEVTMYGEETYPEADPCGPTTLDEPTPSSALDLDRLVWDPEYRNEMRTSWSHGV